MEEAYTVVRRENALILSSDKDKQVTQYQPITKNDIPDWVIQLLDGINGELGRIDAFIQEAKEKNFEIRSALPELAQAYEGLINRQNEIYDPICQGVEKMERAQFAKHSDIVVQSQVFAANIQAAFAVMKAQSTEAYEELRLALSEQIQRSGKAWNTLSTLLDNRERSQERLALQVHLQSQELATIQFKAKEDGERMSGLYEKARADAKKMQDAQKKAQKKADSAERETVFSTVPSVRPHLGRERDGKTPSVLGQDGNGAVFLEEDGDGRLGRPMTEFSPSPAVNYRHPRMLISQYEARERTAPDHEARECIAPNSEATLYRTKLPLRRVKLENAPLQTTKLEKAPLRRSYSLPKLENAPLRTTKLLSIERRLFAWRSLERKDTTGPKAEAAGLMS
ncbi:hypothetical protein BDD12DRAFT_877685 [Trichophaea hybrida]|nr:hypothetical protein BDD12DRAFT_877685 [Trichophaea hybrida]